MRPLSFFPRAMLALVTCVLAMPAVAAVGTKQLSSDQLAAMFARACADNMALEETFEEQMRFYGFVEGAEQVLSNDIHAVLFRLIETPQGKYCQMFYTSNAYSGEELTRTIATEAFGGWDKIDYNFTRRFDPANASFTYALNPFIPAYFTHQIESVRDGQTWYVAVVALPKE